jgi:hypothetical protein
VKNFNELSGPWAGLSVQDGIRISERMQLSIRQGQVSGTGKDKDGEFEVSGFYKERNQKVMLTRRYTRTTEPSQEGVGIAYDYEGLWDGAMVAGNWRARLHSGMGGPFEMWPDRDEDREELTIRFEERKLLALPG